jgi:hypothetical protein
MEVIDLQMADSPVRTDFIRLSVEVRYQWRLVSSEVIWFELPRKLAREVGGRGDPWLVSLLPLAVTLHEKIALIDLPVDPQLLSNLDRLMAIWNGWYPRLRPVSIEAETDPAKPGARTSRTAAFFSGGVDSFYTLLHNQAQGSRGIDELIFLHGADIPLPNAVACATAFAGAQRAASAFDLPVVLIATNLRSTLFRLTDWNLLGFGALMAGAALQLQARYGRCLIPSSGYPGKHPPQGSHPETDPLFSTSRTSFIRDGSGTSRIEKTRFIAQYSIAMNNLRVCWESKTGDNCGRCAKCLRTMATLEVLGKLDACPVFPEKAFSLDAIRHLYLSYTLPYLLDVQDFAAEQGRADIAEAIATSVKRSGRLSRWLLVGQLQRLRRQLAHNPGARQWMGSPYRWLCLLGKWFNRLLA